MYNDKDISNDRLLLLYTTVQHLTVARQEFEPETHNEKINALTLHFHTTLQCHHVKLAQILQEIGADGMVRRQTSDNVSSRNGNVDVRS
jgi:hypothetical protein